MRSLRLLVLGPLVVLASCQLDLTASSFPCLSNEHCAPGYACHPEQQLCVDARSVPSVLDGGPSPDGGELVDAGDDAGADEPDAGDDDAGALDGGLVDAGQIDAGVNLPPSLHPIDVRCQEGTPCPLTLDADDDGPRSALSGLLVTPPTRGTLSAFDGLNATYVPDDGVMGEDSFTVRVSDGALESAEVTVHVRVISRRSCAHLLLSDAALASGVYTLLPGGPGSPGLDVFCDMEREGGGWALALKADGSQPTFPYESALWTDEQLHNESAHTLDDTEAKLAPFRDLPVAQTLVLMRDVAAPWTTAQSVTLKARAASLRELFAAGEHVPTTVGARSWLGLVTNASLQPNCGAQGFNVSPGSMEFARARVGLVGNEQNNCTSPDSFVGVGTSAAICAGPTVSVGNHACHGATHGDRLQPAFAALLVRPDEFLGLDARPSCSAHLAAGRRIDGVYPILPDGDGAAFPAYCDMTTDGGGWTLLMRIAGDSSSHVLDNGAVGSAPCRPDGDECKLSTETLDALIAHEGAQVFAIRPDGGFEPFFVRAASDEERWPPDLEASSRQLLLDDERHAWVVTAYRHLAGAELAQDGFLGTWPGADHYYPSLWPNAQALFRGSGTGLRSVQSWAAPAALVDDLSGALWVRTSGFEHLGVAESCLAHLALGHEQDGVYLVGDAAAPLRVYCDMTTRGGGWTVLASYSGEDGEAPLVTSTTRADGNPFGFGHLSLALADKVALSASATESLLVRAGGRWLHVDEALFDPSMLVPGSQGTFPVTVSSDDGTSAPAAVGWSRAGIAAGGDFGISVSDPPFDHHNPSFYWKLNAGCAGMLLYSYSVSVLDGDVGYDVNTPLGSWSVTYSCEPWEGGRLRFYVAVR